MGGPCLFWESTNSGPPKQLLTGPPLGNSDTELAAFLLLLYLLITPLGQMLKCCKLLKAPRPVRCWGWGHCLARDAPWPLPRLCAETAALWGQPDCT